MLEHIRLALRLTDEVFDGEIKALIEACKADLKTSGVVHINDSDPLILQAVTLYCKGHFGYADIGEKYLQVYESLKTPLRLARSGKKAAAFENKCTEGDLTTGGDDDDE